MKKDRKNDDWDDGRVIAPMDGSELPYYRRIFAPKRKDKAPEDKVQLTKEEKRSMRRGMFAAMMPQLLVIILGFGVAAGLIALWLM